MAGGFSPQIVGPALIELFDSRREVMSDRPSAECVYVAVNCADEAAVRTQCAGIPGAYNGIQLIAIEIAERINDTTWKVIARYGAQNQTVITYDTGGGTEHITQSIQTVGKYGSYSDDLAGAIGYDGEHVQGVDITVPNFTWTETHYLSDAQMAASYPYCLLLTGKVNNAPFRALDAGQVLFMGCQGQKRGAAGMWEVTFKFALKMNQIAITVGGITGIEKAGWDYMWIQYADAPDASSGIKIRKPVAVYVEQVYEYMDLSLLGI